MNVVEVFEGLFNALISTRASYAITHPFVCQRGFVSTPSYGGTLPVVIRDLTRCPKHTMESRSSSVVKVTNHDDLCWHHPVLDDALIAAYLIGGSESVVSQPVFREWNPMWPERDDFKPKMKHLFKFADAEMWHNALHALAGAMYDAGEDRKTVTFQWRLRPQRARQVSTVVRTTITLPSRARR